MNTPRSSIMLPGVFPFMSEFSEPFPLPENAPDSKLIPNAEDCPGSREQGRLNDDKQGILLDPFAQ